MVLTQPWLLNYDAGMLHLYRDFVRKAKQVGLIGAVIHSGVVLRRKFNPQPPDPFDAMYGVETAEIVSVGALDIAANNLAHCNRYEAVVPEMFQRIMRDLPIRYEDFTFIDIGSGKGRAVLLASMCPFARVIGVEISERLTEIARNNIAKFPASVCRNVTALAMSGTDYIPPAAPLVLYLNNPFDESIMSPFVEHVERALAGYPVWVVYQRPLHRAVWDRSLKFREFKTTDRYVIYTST